MTKTTFSRLAACAVLALMPFGAMAQDDTTTEDPVGFNTGQELNTQAGTTYTREEFTDWLMRCVRREDGVEKETDPCQLYQLLKDQNGNSVAEISILALLKKQGTAVAGATIITPLETLLTQQLTMRVDGGTAKKYPFTWCSTIGCYSRIGFTEAEVQRFKNGIKAEVFVVPVAAADQRVVLTVSLAGFTAGFEAVKAANAAIAAAAAPAPTE